MREIKFRVWNKMFPSISNYSNQYGSLASFWGEFEKHDGVFMQYTGLKDKNSIEIYEGDIVTDGKMTGKVEYLPPGFAVIVGEDDRWWLGAGLSYPDNYQLKETKVIGNIYSNPELLDKPIDTGGIKD